MVINNLSLAHLHKWWQLTCLLTGKTVQSTFLIENVILLSEGVNPCSNIEGRGGG